MGRPVAQTSLTLSFECDMAEGALLLLKTPASRVRLEATERFRAYMKDNFSSWEQFAKLTGREVPPSDIIFVTGYDKTAAWALAAFTERSRKTIIAFGGGYLPIATGGLSISGAWSSVAGVQRREGPEAFLRQIPANNTVISELPQSQCVFLRSFKMRKRKWIAPEVMEGAAKPRDEPTSKDDNDDGGALSEAVSDEDGSSTYTVEPAVIEYVCSLLSSNRTQSNPTMQSYHPVDAVLDYIMEVCILISRFVRLNTHSGRDFCELE